MFTMQFIRPACVACLLIALTGLAVSSQTEGKGRPEQGGGKAEADPQAPATPRFDPLTLIVAPRELNAASGHGKILVYAREPGGERIKANSDRFKEVELETSWCVVTGSLPSSTILSNFVRARVFVNGAMASAYTRVDLERQVRGADGAWSNWSPVDAGPTLEILENVPEEDEELLPEEYRLASLCDPLPHLTTGAWQGVHLERLVPRGVVQVHSPLPGTTPPDRPAPSTALQPGLMRPADSIPFLSSLPAELMIRSFDFSVSRGYAYRYRARRGRSRTSSGSTRRRMVRGLERSDTGGLCALNDGGPEPSSRWTQADIRPVSSSSE